MSQRHYEVFEHTADVGILAYGQTLPELFIHAAEGMESLMVPPGQVREVVAREISVRGHDVVSLLVSWLSELIFLFDTEYLLFSTFAIENFTEKALKGHAIGERYDELRHELGSAIKAVTWHEAAVARTEEGYKVHVIFDI